MSPLKGSVILTGANGGLGRGFVSHFIKSAHSKDFRGIYTVRNPSTAHELNALLATAPPDRTSEVLALDLNSLEKIREFAEVTNDRVAKGTLEPIRALILNAGFQDTSKNALKPQTFTSDGYETTFGVNYLANFILVLLLLRSMDKEHGRIVFVASWTHDPHDKRNNMMGAYNEEEYKTVLGDVQALAKGIEYHDDGAKAGMRRYGSSKTLLVMFMYELQRRINLDPELSNISALAVDPGGMWTGMAKRGATSFLMSLVIPWLGAILVWFSPNGILRTPSKSGGDLLLASFDEKAIGPHPKALYLNGNEKGQSGPEARDEKKQKLLWIESLKLARIGKDDTVLSHWD